MMEFLRRFAHNVLGWHNGDGEPKGFDGLSSFAVCTRCWRRVLMDSQGNWFTIEEEE